MYLVSVYFDDIANRVLQRYIDQVAERTGNAFMTEKNVPPHMTISSIEASILVICQEIFEKDFDMFFLKKGALHHRS